MIQTYVDVDQDGFGDDASAALTCPDEEGRTAQGGDCHDGDPAVSPAATEVCDSLDNNCNVFIDEGLQKTDFYLDADGDFYGVEDDIVRTCAKPPGYTATLGDCDDSNATVNPGHPEICDDIDNDCDNLIDDDDDMDPADLPDWFWDGDGDGFGDPSVVTKACDKPYTQAVLDDTDCDDLDAATYPGANEVCGGGDESCDGLVDDDDPLLDLASASTWYADTDGDGLGDASNTQISCLPGPDYGTDTSDCDDTNAAILGPQAWLSDNDGDGYGDAFAGSACTAPTGNAVLAGGSVDCDDSDAAIHPAADEVCDNADNDCDGLIDDADPSTDPATMATWYDDNDSDGYGNANITMLQCDRPWPWVSNDTDCDDNDALTNPAGNEICGGGDEDCDALVDDADNTLDVSSTTVWWPDTDGDGLGAGGQPTINACAPPVDHVANSADCDDSDAAVRGADPYDRDNDGDGFGDGYIGAYCTQPPSSVPSGGGVDCDDGDAAVNPSATEVCDGIDNECDGLVDDSDPSTDPNTETWWYADNDSDGFGAAPTGLRQCTQPFGWVTDDQDCDDNDPATHPLAQEVCGGGDDDCDGLADDNDSSVDLATADTWYPDNDNDGLGAGGSYQYTQCAGPNGYVNNSGDCDDSDPLVAGSGGFDVDNDGDGYGDGFLGLFCTQPANGVPEGGLVDCDDSNAAVNPGHIEICDGLDNDCDGFPDDFDNDTDPATMTIWYSDFDGDSYGGPASVLQCTSPVGWVTNTDDCNDADSYSYPGALEVCGGGDNNCDGLVDDADPLLDLASTLPWYFDNDGDGLGDATVWVDACMPPSPYYVGNQADCDDTDPLATTLRDWSDDLDGDGVGSIPLGAFCNPPSGTAVPTGNGFDCDDTDPTINPHEVDVPGDGIDSDCDGQDAVWLFDDFDTGSTDFSVWSSITGDTFHSSSYSTSGTYSLNLGGGGATATSVSIDTTNCVTIEVSWEGKRGPETPDSGDDVVVEYYSNTGSWLNAYTWGGIGTTDSGFSSYSDLITASSAKHAGFQVRLVSSGSGSSFDDFFVDDFLVQCI